MGTLVMAPRMEIFVVNLDRSAERWAAMQSWLASLPYVVTRIAALDARGDKASVLTARGRSLIDSPDGVGVNPYRGRHVALVEEACFASHMLAVNAFLESDATHGLVLEDDVYPLRDVMPELDALMAAPVPFDLVRLEGSRYRGGRLATPLARIESAQLVASFAPCPGAGAYVMTRAGARKILENAPRMLMPVDDFLVNPALNGCDTLNVAPWLFSQKGADSVITSVTGPKRYKVKRNIAQNLWQLGARLCLRGALIRQAAGYSIRAKRLPRITPWTTQD